MEGGNPGHEMEREASAERSLVFGIRVPGCRYSVRPSAYVILRDDTGRIAVVRAVRGWFLPGGGIEPGETPEQAAIRETSEECGFIVRIGRTIGAATEIVHSPAGHTGIDKESTFFEAVVIGMTTEVKPEHEIAWLTFTEAAERLAHASHRWAIRAS